MNQQSSISSPLRSVELVTRNIQRAATFYTDGLGFHVVDKFSGALGLSATPSGAAQVILREDPNARERMRGSAGLYHLAIRVPSRGELGRVLLRLLENGIRLHGGADHGVSEALYLADNDGNGIEIYVDRPADAWPRIDGALAMITEQLDGSGIVEAAGSSPDLTAPIHPETDLGHIHLQVSSLEIARSFYGNILGMDVTQGNFPGALFLALDGYHHHVGVNVWDSRSGASASQDVVGLSSFTLALPPSRRTRILANLDKTAIRPMTSTEHQLVLNDGDGIRVQIEFITTTSQSIINNQVQYA